MPNCKEEHYKIDFSHQFECKLLNFQQNNTELPLITLLSVYDCLLEGLFMTKNNRQ